MKKRILKLWIFFAKKICCPFVNIPIFVVLLIDYGDSLVSNKNGLVKKLIK